MACEIKAPGTAGNSHRKTMTILYTRPDLDAIRARHTEAHQMAGAFDVGERRTGHNTLPYFLKLAKCDTHRRRLVALYMVPALSRMRCSRVDCSRVRTNGWKAEEIDARPDAA